MLFLSFPYSPSPIMFPGWDQASSGSQQGSNEGKAAAAEAAGGDWADEKLNPQTEGASQECWGWSTTCKYFYIQYMRREIIFQRRSSHNQLPDTLLALLTFVHSPKETAVPRTLVTEPASPSVRGADDNRSPSPSLSISGSETSSIMQKLKKMHSHMDEK